MIIINLFKHRPVSWMILCLFIGTLLTMFLYESDNAYIYEKLYTGKYTLVVVETNIVDSDTTYVVELKTD